jgi:hypothetical protein
MTITHYILSITSIALIALYATIPHADQLITSFI